VDEGKFMTRLSRPQAGRRRSMKFAANGAIS